MKTVAMLLAVVGIIGALVIGIVGISSYVKYSNQAVDLETRFSAKQTANEASYDKVWHIIEGQAGVASQYKDDFGSVYKDMMSERYKPGSGQLMQWIQEHNPNFDSSLYKQVSVSIEAQRTEFLAEQKELLDIKREHDKLRLQFPGSLFLSGRKPLEAKIVTSTRTEESFKTGKDDAPADPFHGVRKTKAEEKNGQ